MAASTARMQPDFSDSAGSVESALLAYRASPGRYALLRHEPKLLFSCLREVLMLAGGRSISGEGQPSADVQEAAGLFVRAAMLHPGADHYALLGLDQAASQDAIKDRYRLLMRLMHPDFAPSAESSIWPPDSAARVNRAYETLSSTEERRLYNQSLEDPLQRPAAAPTSTTAAMRAAAARPTTDPRRRLWILAAAFGSAGLVLVAAVVVLGGSERESLVQRDSTAIVASRKAVEAIPPFAQTDSAAMLSKAEAAQQEVPVSTSASVGSALPPRIIAADPASAVVMVEAPPAPPQPVVAAAPLKAPLPIARTVSGAASERPTLRLATAVTSPRPAEMPRAAISVVPTPVPAVAVPASPPGTGTSTPSTQVAFVEPAPANPPAAPAPARAAAPAKPPTLTLAEVHPLLARLVQQVECGTGDRLLILLERDAQREAGAQALVRQYNSLVDGGPVKVSKVQFRSEPFDGGLVVTGYMVMEVGSASAPGKEFAVQAEFANRNGSVVMTGLSRANGQRR